jgi:hypothetical protein
MIARGAGKRKNYMTKNSETPVSPAFRWKARRSGFKEKPNAKKPGPA